MMYSATRFEAAFCRASILAILAAVSLPAGAQTSQSRDVGGGAVAIVSVNPNGNGFVANVEGRGPGNCQVRRTLNGPGSASINQLCDAGGVLGDVRIRGSASMSGYTRANGRVLFNVRLSGTVVDDTLIGDISIPGGNVNEVFYFDFEDPIEREQVQSGLAGVKFLVARHSNKCVDVSQVSTADRQPIHQWDCLGADNQKWELRPINGNFQLVARHSNKCMENMHSRDNGFQLLQWPCHAGTEQQWRFVNIAGGYQIVSVSSGKCIDVRGPSTDNGAAIQQWDCVGASQINQIFELRDAGQ